MPSFVSSIAAVCLLVVGVGGGGGRVFPLVDTDNSVFFCWLFVLSWGLNGFVWWFYGLSAAVVPVFGWGGGGVFIHQRRV